mmetsp:Transcript_102465/g.165124  ORF Transcript_102465/g.165124 Transcript_102465/m.165124 type:complete len:154 (+) Transcript_102465:30-491(+)
MYILHIYIHNIYVGLCIPRAPLEDELFHSRAQRNNIPPRTRKKEPPSLNLRPTLQCENKLKCFFQLHSSSWSLHDSMSSRDSTFPAISNIPAVTRIIPKHQASLFFFGCADFRDLSGSCRTEFVFEFLVEVHKTLICCRQPLWGTMVLVSALL